MKIVFPTQVDQGLDSAVFGHFGSAPCFVLVDDTTGAVESISNVERCTFTDIASRWPRWGAKP